MYAAAIAAVVSSPVKQGYEQEKKKKIERKQGTGKKRRTDSGVGTA